MVVRKVFTVKGTESVVEIMNDIIEASKAVEAAVTHFNECVQRANNVTIEINEE
jgi:hypothetical protein